MRETLVILGACGSSRDVCWIYWEHVPEGRVLFVDDVNDVTSVALSDRTVPVVKDWDFVRYREKPADFTMFTCGMGVPRSKRVMVQRALGAGLAPAPPLVSLHAVVRPDAILGAGTVVHPQALVSSEVRAGKYVTVHSAKVAHDVTLGDFATVSPNCGVAGYATLGEGVYMGACSSVRERISIAPWVSIGLNACVVQDVTHAEQIVVGVPARPITQSTRS